MRGLVSAGMLATSSVRLSLCRQTTTRANSQFRSPGQQQNPMSAGPVFRRLFNGGRSWMSSRASARAAEPAHSRGGHKLQGGRRRIRLPKVVHDGTTADKMIKGMKNFFLSQPLMANSMSLAVLYASAELTQQTINRLFLIYHNLGGGKMSNFFEVDKELKLKYDFRQMGNFAVVGGLFYGPLFRYDE